MDIVAEFKRYFAYSQDLDAISSIGRFGSHGWLIALLRGRPVVQKLIAAARTTPAYKIKIATLTTYLDPPAKILYINRPVLEYIV